MPKKKKNELPSGSIRKQIYSHSEIVYDENGKIVLDPKTGKPRMKKIYISVTGKNANEVKAAAATVCLKKRSFENPEDMTVAEAIHRYLGSSDRVLSPAGCLFRSVSHRPPRVPHVSFSPSICRIYPA